MELPTYLDAFATSNPVLAGMHREADGIQAVIQAPVDKDNPSLLTERLGELDVYLARLGDMRVRAKALKEWARNKFLEENEAEISKMTATVSNRRIQTFLFEYSVAVERLDTMYDTVGRLSRDLVTQISFIKQEMQMR